VAPPTPQSVQDPACDEDSPDRFDLRSARRHTLRLRLPGGRKARSPARSTPHAGAGRCSPRRGRPGRRHWLLDGRTYADQRFSSLVQIDEPNVAQLGLLRSHDTQPRRGLEATPIVVDGVSYASGSWSVVFAVDARSGREIWTWDPQVPRSYGQRACCDVVNRGVAVYRGRVYASVLENVVSAAVQRCARGQSSS